MNFGSVSSFNEGKSYSKDSLTGYFIHSDSITFIKHQDIFEGIIGLTFGIEYYLEGFDPLTKNEDVHFISKIIHPLITNPETNQSGSETIEHKYSYNNQINYDYITFEYDWEIKPGIWIFQVIEDEAILLENYFIIT